jgi:hypothetical protein
MPRPLHFKRDIAAQNAFKKAAISIGHGRAGRRSSGKNPREIFKNYALESIDAVRAKLEHAILYIERNPKLVQSITSFPYIAKSL